MHEYIFSNNSHIHFPSTSLAYGHPTSVIKNENNIDNYLDRFTVVRQESENKSQSQKKPWNSYPLVS